MKVLVIGSFDLYLHPYIEKYIAIFSQLNIEYNFIYWNRKNIINNNDFFIPFNYKLNVDSGKIKKIIGYIKFYSYVKKILKQNKFDRLIILTSQPMILFNKTITKKYSGKYIFDYRDETYEKYKLYKKLILNSVENSQMTVVSSYGFVENILNKYKEKIILCHNLKDRYFPPMNHIESEKIRINFWGMIRELDYYKKIIDVFGNDDRFIVNLYGEGNSSIIQNYTEEKKYSNIYFHGKYVQQDIPIIASNTDYLLNCYSNFGIQKNSLTVKLYEGIYYNIPMIVQKNSYMDKFLKENKVNFISVDFDYSNTNDMEKIKLSLINLNKKIINNSDQLLIKFRKENELFMKKIINLLEKGEYCE